MRSVGSPRAVNALLQRVGRAGHAIGAVPKGRLFPLALDDLLECAALLDAVAGDELETRDKAMFELFYSSGLRLAELGGLDARFFDEVEDLKAEAHALRAGAAEVLCALLRVDLFELDTHRAAAHLQSEVSGGGDSGERIEDHRPRQWRHHPHRRRVAGQHAKAGWSRSHASNLQSLRLPSTVFDPWTAPPNRAEKCPRGSASFRAPA